MMRWLAVVVLVLSGQAALGTTPDADVKIIEIKLNHSFTPISLLGDKTQDVIIDVTNSIIGTVENGYVSVLINMVRVEGEERTAARPNWWSDGFAKVNSEDGHGNNNAPASTEFAWSTHVGEFSYKSVRIFQRFVHDRFDGSYLISTDLQQSADAKSLEDLDGAALTIRLYKLVDEGCHGTGFPHDFVLRLVATVPTSKVTGNPSELQGDFERLVQNDSTPMVTGDDRACRG